MNLIERLRRQVEFLIEFWGGDPEDPDHAGLRLYREAADEIERLGQCQFEPSGDNHHNAALCPHCGEPLRKALAEIERLRGENSQLAAALACREEAEKTERGGT